VCSSDLWYVYEWVEGASATPAPTTVSGASGWQLIKTPVSGTVTTNDYMVEYSANVVTYHSYHAYGNMKVVKGTLLNQLPQTIQVGEKLTLNTSAELISIQEGIDQTNFSGVLTAQGGIKYGKIYSIVNDNGVNFPKTNTLEVIAEKGDPSKTSEGHYIRIRFDCNGYDASQLDNWYVYEWVEGTGSGSAAVSPGANRIILTLGNPSFTVNGSKQEIDPGKGTKPVTLNGRTVIPIRAVVEAMGGTVAWDPATNRITLTANGITLEMWLGSYVITVNGVTKQIEVAPSTISGRTMVPVRFAAENLGCGVNWDPVNKVVTITY
ncbi:MAG: copper amine oxidase N-terminal domain-containing protein, partial [Clostridiales bacterium]|nr:copper amine oxidase N-terminal domain-containing protein [Clostridiales bacterium]